MARIQGGPRVREDLMNTRLNLGEERKEFIGLQWLRQTASEREEESYCYMLILTSYI